MIGLYKTFVRPILESSVSAWSPWERRDIDAMEKIQRRATRMVPTIAGNDYDTRLKMCRLTTLERRRIRGDMIEVFKMLNGHTKVDDDFFTFSSERHNAATRSVTNKCLVSEKCRLDIRKYFFTNRIVQHWNVLPLDIREANCVNDFKNLYDDWTSDENCNMS